MLLHTTLNFGYQHHPTLSNGDFVADTLRRIEFIVQKEWRFLLTMNRFIKILIDNLHQAGMLKLPLNLDTFEVSKLNFVMENFTKDEIASELVEAISEIKEALFILQIYSDREDTQNKLNGMLSTAEEMLKKIHATLDKKIDSL